MKINYNYLNGETTTIEVSEEWGELLLEMDRAESNGDRKQRYHCYSLDLGEEMGCQYACESNIEDLFREPSREERVWTTLKKMKENQRQLLIDYYFLRMSQEALAKKHGVSQQAISLRIATAEKNFKKLF